MPVVTTFNLDSTVCGGRKQDDLVELLEGGSDIIMVQEANKTNIRNLLPGTHKTNQVMKNEGTKDSAIIWRDSMFSLEGTSQVRARAAHSAGTNMYARYFSIASLKHKGTGNVVRVISCNFPYQPARLRTILQTPMARNLVSVVRDRRIARFIIGADFNFNVDNDPYDLRNRLEMISASNGRAGFYLTDNLNMRNVTTGPRANSDHLPVSITVDI